MKARNIIIFILVYIALFFYVNFFYAIKVPYFSYEAMSKTFSVLIFSFVGMFVYFWFQKKDSEHSWESSSATLSKKIDNKSYIDVG